ncbi:unnamed protein product [Pylaiella littoralis]
MENGVRLSSRASQQQQQQQQQQLSGRGGGTGPRQPAVGRPLQPRFFSSNRTSGSRAPSPFGRSLMPSSAALLPSAARVASGSSSSFSLGTRSNSSSSSGGGGGSGLWASIMSFGAAALPASLSSLSPTAAVGAPSSSSSLSASPPRHGARRNASVVLPGTGTGTRTRRNPSSPSPSSSSSLSEGVPSAAGAVAGHSRVGGAGRAVASAGAGTGAGAVVDAGGRGGVRAQPLPIGGAPPSAPGGRVNHWNNPSVSAVGEQAAVAVAAPLSGSAAGGGKARSAQKQVFLEGENTVYTCSMCRAHLATRDHVISECFHGHRGRAFLFERCVNVAAGRPENRMLTTGMHVVADISCKSCGAELGWKYEGAVEKSQKYKVGKFILERFAVTVEGRSGDGCSGSSRGPAGSDRCSRSRSRGVIGWGADNAPFAESDRW